MEPFKSPVTSDYKYWAIYQNQYTGPAFGQHGEELYIAYNAHSSSGANFGKVFKPPPGYTYNAITTKALLGGKNDFYPSEIETYYLADN